MPTLTVLRMPRLFKSAAVLLIMTTLLMNSAGCHRSNRTAERLAEDTAAAKEIDSSLTFNNITLEQADEQGRTLWKVKAAQANYSQDKQIAQVKKPNGDLFQDGKPIFRVQGDQGEVRENGQRILLQGQVVATDLRSGAILRGDQMEWIPKRNLLVLRNNLRGTHSQLRIAANEAKMYTRDQRLEMSGQVTAFSKDPDLRLQAEHLIWNMKAETVVSDRPTQIDRLQGNRIIDTANGDQAQFNLKTKIATLTSNAQLTLTDPPVKVSGNSLRWNLKQKTLVSDQPLTVVHRQEQVTLTANRGWMDMDKRMLYLTQNVRAVGQRNQSQLSGDRLTWNIPTQEFVAEGNVNYRQSDPVVTVRGPRAVGKLQNQTIVVSGGRVVTQIVPDQIVPPTPRVE